MVQVGGATIRGLFNGALQSKTRVYKIGRQFWLVVNKFNTIVESIPKQCVVSLNCHVELELHRTSHSSA